MTICNFAVRHDMTGDDEISPKPEDFITRDGDSVNIRDSRIKI